MTRDRSRHVVLVEPHWHGHHGTYMRHFSRVLLEQGHRVTALCPYPAEPTTYLAKAHPELAPRFQAFHFSRPSPVPAGTRWPERAFAVKFWTETARAIAANRVDSPDLVFLNWLDTYVHPYLPGVEIDRLFPHPWSGLYFFPGEHRGTSRHTGLARTLLTRGLPFRSRNCRGIAVLDEVAQTPLARQLAPRPAVVFPDLTDETTPAGSELATRVEAAARGRKVIACVGSLSKRKGIYELIRICEQSRERGWFFVFAGKLDLIDFDDRAVRDILRFVQRPPEQALVHLQIVPDGNDFNSLVAASDLLYCHYLAFPHSSNLLTKAALLRRPVLVSDRHCMAERVMRHRLGAGAAEGDLAAIERGLTDILAAPREAGRDFDGYLGQHLAACLQQPFNAILEHVSAAGRN
jgi:glycosyltransferase involved in cell wall biosynthesis